MTTINSMKLYISREKRRVQFIIFLRTRKSFSRNYLLEIEVFITYEAACIEILQFYRIFARILQLENITKEFVHRISENKRKEFFEYAYLIIERLYQRLEGR